MKKKIIIVSIGVNLIAGFFIFMAFNFKSNKTGNPSGNFIYMNVNERVVITDDKSTLADINLTGGWTKFQVRRNYQIITHAFDSLKNQGYDLVSSNGDHYESNYIFEKK